MSNLNNTTTNQNNPQAESSPEGPARNLPRILRNEIRLMMYGFGDVQKPLPETVALVEELVIEFISKLVRDSTALAHSRRRERPDITDVKFVIRKDRKKAQRIRYLMDMNQEIQRAKNGLNFLDDVPEAAGAGAPGGAGAPKRPKL